MVILAVFSKTAILSKPPKNQFPFSQEVFAVPVSVVGCVTFKNDPTCDATTKFLFMPPSLITFSNRV